MSDTRYRWQELTPPPKERYALLVRRGDEVIGEYVFHATPEGLSQLKACIKPEFQYRILDADGVIYRSESAQ